MTNTDAKIVASDMLERHIVKLYYPDQAMRLFPKVPKDDFIRKKCFEIEKEFIFPDTSQKILFESLSYALSCIESEYLTHRKVAPGLYKELDEVLDLFLRTKRKLRLQQGRLFFLDE